MALPTGFEHWLKGRIADGDAEVFRQENFSEGAIPHCVTIEGGFVRLYVWTDREECSEEKVETLRRFVLGAFSASYAGGEPLVKKVKTALEKGKGRSDAGDPDDEEPIDNGDGEKPRVAFEIVSPRQMAPAAVQALESGLKGKLVIQTASGNIIFRPEANIHWSGQSLDALKYLPVTHPPQNLYSSDDSEAKSLQFEVVRFGDLYRSIIRPGGEAVYASNVRGFLGRTLTNNRLERAYLQIIAEGRRSQAFTLFPFMNNGVTISCSEIDLDKENSRVGVECPQIVNGQQTTRTWEKVYLQQVDDRVKSLLESLPVVVKFVQLPDEKLIRDVAFSNNRQNPISADTLRSNEPVLVRIEAAWNGLVSGEGLPRFGRKVKRGDWVSPRRLFEMDHYLAKGKKASMNTVETFFDDGEEFDAFFRKVEKLIQDQERIPGIARLYQHWTYITRNHYSTNGDRRKILNTAFSLSGSKKNARHPFFAVGKPGWNLRVALLVRAIHQTGLALPDRELLWIAGQLREQFEGVAERMLEDLQRYADERPCNQDEDEDEGRLDNRHPELWDEWMVKSDRYAHYLVQVGLQKRGIVTAGD